MEKGQRQNARWLSSSSSSKPKIEPIKKGLLTKYQKQNKIPPPQDFITALQEEEGK